MRLNPTIEKYCNQEKETDEQEVLSNQDHDAIEGIIDNETDSFKEANQEVITDNLCDGQNNFLQNLKSPGSCRTDSDEETTEQISEFLRRELEEKTDEEIVEENRSAAPPQAEEVPVEGSFKMPESFDLPTDFIKEILPTRPKPSFDKDPAKRLKLSSSTKTTLDEPRKAEEPRTPKKQQPVQDKLDTIMYEKVRNQGVQGKLTPNRDRRKMMAALFDDSDPDSTESAEQSSSSDKVRSNPVAPEPEKQRKDDLEEKRRRIKSKLETSSSSRMTKPSALQDLKKKLPVKSSASCSKNQDEDFIASDSEEPQLLRMPRDLSSDSSDYESFSSGTEDRGERLKSRRQRRKGGDVLAWMSRRARVSVKVQTHPTEGYFLDMAQFRCDT